MFILELCCNLRFLQCQWNKNVMKENLRIMFSMETKRFLKKNKQNKVFEWIILNSLFVWIESILFTNFWKNDLAKKEVNAKFNFKLGYGIWHFCERCNQRHIIENLIFHFFTLRLIYWRQQRFYIFIRITFILRIIKVLIII